MATVMAKARRGAADAIRIAYYKQLTYLLFGSYLRGLFRFLSIKRIALSFSKIRKENALTEALVNKSTGGDAHVANKTILEQFLIKK